jgi:hypothetical protein
VQFKNWSILDICGKLILESRYSNKVRGDNMVTKDMIIADVIEKFPRALEVFAKHGLRCVG